MMSGKYMITQMLGLVGMMMVVGVASHDYGDALSKCILFFEGQRSGKLPSTQRMTWRKDSALRDGSDIGMDLVGGYYDAGDNIKFNFPMAFTTTLLAWSILEFGDQMGSEKKHALEALKWGTDYFLKSTSVPGKVVAQVGEPMSDHNCWERPEDMDTLRKSYVVDTKKPGSEVSAEIAAALAASSIVFKYFDVRYSRILLRRASEVFKFADQYQGSYNLSVGDGVCPFYCNSNGYLDELVWGAAWLYKATNNRSYWDYVGNKFQHLENFWREPINGVFVGGSFLDFGWDDKHAGISILVSRMVMNNSTSDRFVCRADDFVCSVLPESPNKTVEYSPGGLMFKPGGSNTQHATTLSFLLLVYSRYLARSSRNIKCGNVNVTPARLVQVAKSQVDYLLGSNPLEMSYMVGYGTKFPRKIHHRGSSLPSISVHPQPIRCPEGSEFFKSNNPNSNLLTGAIVGGPDKNDLYNDTREQASKSEPTTYINAPFVGVLAYFKAYPNT